MEQSQLLPQIEVSLILTSDQDFSQDITDKLNIQPTRTRSKSEIRVVDYAQFSWELTIGKEHSTAIFYQCEKMRALLKGKEKDLQRLVEGFDLRAQLLIIVHAESGSEPELILNKEFVAMSAVIQAEIGFDIYVYP